MSMQHDNIESPRNYDDILIAEGDMVFKFLMAIIVGAFAAFGLIFLASLFGFPDFLIAV